MKDRNRFLFGLCEMSASIQFENLMNLCLNNEIEVFHPVIKEDKIIFYCLIDQKSKLMKLIPGCQYHKTTGVLGFLFSELKRPFHLFLICWILCLYLFLSHTILKVEFQSTSLSLQHEIEEYLTQNQIEKGTLVLEDDFDVQLKESIKHEFLHEIAWIEVKRNASLLNISFNHKETRDVLTFQNQPLISTKHAMIVRFEILHGYKMAHVNQIVKPDDVLVQPYLIDSAGNMKSLYVSGKVYGITWYTVFSEIDKQSEMNVLDYFRLLMNCRSQIEKEISIDEQVLKENILQFIENEGKIRMTVHYSCLEDITKQ